MLTNHYEIGAVFLEQVSWTRKQTVTNGNLLTACRKVLGSPRPLIPTISPECTIHLPVYSRF